MAQNSWIKKIKEFLPDRNDFEEVQRIVKENRTTRKVIYECLYYGLDLEECGFLTEFHKYNTSLEVPLKPLRQLFIQVGKDKIAFMDAIDMIEEDHEKLLASVPSSVEFYRRDSYILYETMRHLRQYNNSIETLSYMEIRDTFYLYEDGGEES